MRNSEMPKMKCNSSKEYRRNFHKKKEIFVCSCNSSNCFASFETHFFSSIFVIWFRLSIVVTCCPNSPSHSFFFSPFSNSSFFVFICFVLLFLFLVRHRLTTLSREMGMQTFNELRLRSVMWYVIQPKQTATRSDRFHKKRARKRVRTQFPWSERRSKST